MKYRALMLDLDGTTVKNEPHARPSPRVKAAIAAIKDTLHVCVATGRILKDALPIIEELDLTGPCITTNGVQIYDPRAKKIIEEISMTPEVITQAFAICQRYQVRTWRFDGVVETEFISPAAEQKTLSLFIPDITSTQADSLIDDFKKIANTNTHKTLSWQKDLYGLEVTSANASKLHGIGVVAQTLGIQTHEIIGVGDGYNDFPLLLACGLKFAMRNAVPELQAIADFIAPSVTKDGVAVIIEKFLLPQLP
jgi:HAD superfamily hydrolase (TIGR01484 family)